MKQFVVSIVSMLMSSAVMAIGLGGTMRDVNEESSIYCYNSETKQLERCEGPAEPGWSYADPERIGEVTSIRREPSGDIAVKRYGSGFVEEVWTETRPGQWERKY